MIMAGHRPRSKRCTWPSRRPWRPATPNTNPDPWPSNAPPGSTKPQQCSADVAPSRRWCRRRSTPPAETATIADARWVAQTADHVLAVMEEQPLDLADVACPRRSPTPGPHRRRARRAGRARWWTCSSMRCSIADRLPWPHRATASRNRRRCGGSTGRRSTPSPAPTCYTSQRILDAEQRLVAAAGRRDGSAVDARRRWIWRCWRWRRTAPPSMPGRPPWSAQMCTSGARLQLAIAPAGAGKTTAMRALALAWTEDGGQVLGLAPSAAAAAVLAEQTGIRTDTLAKLTWSLDHGDLPDWAAAVGPSTLVIIDEAGMADTLSLDTAVQFAIDRGAQCPAGR